MKEQLRAGLDREVSRKEFLAILGVVTCSVLGFGTIVKLFMGGHDFTRQIQRPVTSGYGVSSYGR